MHRRALLSIDNRQFIDILKNQTKQYLQTQTHCALMKHQALLTTRAKLKLVLFLNLSVAMYSGEINASARQEEKNFEVLKSCYI